MEIKKETKGIKVLTTKDDEIKDTSTVFNPSKDVDPNVRKEDLDDSGIDKLSNAEVVVPDDDLTSEEGFKVDEVEDEEDFTYEKTPVAEELENVPNWKEVKSALRRLAALSLSGTEFEILEQSFPKIFGE